MNESIPFLSLYVDPAWRRAEGEVFSPLMIPFWGNPIPETHPFAKELYDSFTYNTEHYGITDDITKATMVFAPYRQAWLMRHDPALLDECSATAKKAGLPLLVDGVADGEQPLYIENAYVLRIGGYRFLTDAYKDTKLPHHLQWESMDTRVEIPTQADDLLIRCEQGVFTPRPRQDTMPVVGFAGMVNISFRETLHTIKKDFSVYVRGIFNKQFRAMYAGIFWRQLAVWILAHSTRVKANFKIRDFYSGSSITAHGEMKDLQRELVDTVLSSDYALDVRGYANASVRLYEILSLGRIPVILNTERILPFSDYIDWSSFSLIVDFRDIHRLPRIISDFHASVTPERFEEMQRTAREVFVKYFRVDAQMPYIIRELVKLKAL